jgi:PAS domain S-box-containing protein
MESALKPLDDLPVMAYVDEVDADGVSTVVFLGGRHVELTGYALDDYEPGARLWDERIHPDDLARYQEEYGRTWRERGALAVRYRYRRRDGTWVWLEDRAGAVYDERRDVTVINGVVFDVTADREADAAAARDNLHLRETAQALRDDLHESLRGLEEREANYRSLFESVDDLGLVCDTDGYVIEANPASTHMVGYTLAELRGRHILELHPEDVREEAGRIVAAMLAGEESACPLPLLAADGSQIPTETRVWHGTWNGEPCIFGISRDLIAEREATERFNRLFHASPAPMAVSAVDEEARFVEVNDAWLRTMGYAREEVIGESSTHLDLFADPEAHLAVAEQLRDTGRVRDARLRVKARDGRIRDGIFSGELVKSQGKTYFLTVMMDDTERRRAEAEQLELNRRLEAANRELVGIVNSIAHDLRTPLRTIGSFAQILEQEHDAELSAPGRDAVRRIIRADGRLERLIDALLDLSGLTRRPLRMEPVALSDIADEVVGDLREADPGRVVEVTVAPGMKTVADPSLTHVVLENLLGNAWKFTQRRAKAHIEIGHTEEHGEDVYFVQDDGAGFDQRYADRLFRPFERLHDEADFDGTGVGLASVQRIVERHGGRVWAEGRVGEGATFFFTLAPSA